MNTTLILQVKHLQLAQLAIVDHNKGFIIPIFCIPYAYFEVGITYPVILLNKKCHKGKTFTPPPPATETLLNLFINQVK